MGIITWFYLISGIVLFLALLIGPVALIIGPILILIGWYTRLGVVMTLTGSGLVTLYFVYALTELLSEPFTTRPSYLPYALVALMTLASDIAAIAVCRAAFRVPVVH
jgi:hypothetical protein